MLSSRNSSVREFLEELLLSEPRFRLPPAEILAKHDTITGSDVKDGLHDPMFKIWSSCALVDVSCWWFELNSAPSCWGLVLRLLGIKLFQLFVASFQVAPNSCLSLLLDGVSSPASSPRLSLPVDDSLSELMSIFSSGKTYGLFNIVKSSFIFNLRESQSCISWTHTFITITLNTKWQQNNSKLYTKS